MCDNRSCMNGVKLEKGKDILCKCDDGYSGEECQLRIRSFDGHSSSINFPHKQKIASLSLEFRTANPSSLLLSSFSIGNSGIHLFSLILKNGQVHLISSSRGKKKELAVEEKVNDGSWKRIRLRSKRRAVKLTVEKCDEAGFCEPCKNNRCVAIASDFE
ncbi:unnamed protein product [Gongylonema pulchrum]|uniref:EGF-like domain-containing protein n=1 Tax=Gongylonema pulchrum TaxID=637853 RepID=A0A183F0U9_9BILA|nr:unnamed protein product [Gongylonema pulchrum]